VLLLVAALALTVGWHTRLAALAVFVVMLSFQRRDIFVFNSGDVVLRIEALYLALAPAGAALSLDRRRTAGSFWDAQVRAPWGLRLMQVQLSIIYLTTVHDKLTGTTWNEGTAVSYALRLTDLQAFALPDWLTTNAVLMNFATWGTLVLELSLGVLVWNRRLRPWVLGAGIVMHMIFLLTLAVAFFSFAMYVLYLSFVPEDTARRWVDRVRVRLAAGTAVDTPPAAPAAAALEATDGPPQDAGRTVTEAAARAARAGGAAEPESGGPVTAGVASGSASHPGRAASAPESPAEVPDAQPRTG
jgi:HTTM domain